MLLFPPWPRLAVAALPLERPQLLERPWPHLAVAALPLERPVLLERPWPRLAVAALLWSAQCCWNVRGLVWQWRLYLWSAQCCWNVRRNHNGDAGNPSATATSLSSGAPNGGTSTEAVDAQEQLPVAPRRNLGDQPEIERQEAAQEQPPVTPCRRSCRNLGDQPVIEHQDDQEQRPVAPRRRSRRNLNLQPEIEGQEAVPRRRRSRRNIAQPEFEQQDDPDGYARGQARHQG